MSKSKNIYGLDRSLRLFEIINLLTKDNSLNIKEISKKLNRSHSVISEQVSSLEKENIITKEKKGKEVFITINKENLNFFLRNKIEYLERLLL